MNLAKSISLFAAGTLAASLSSSTAQPSVVTVTNYVTIVVTNVVTITNVVATTPTVTAAAPNVAGAPKAPKPAPKNPWESSVSAGLTLTRGNSDTMLFTADFLTQRKTAFDEYKIGPSASGIICSVNSFTATSARMVCTTRLRTWITG